MAKNSNSYFIDIKGLIKEYLAHWYLFVISVVIICGGAYLFLKSKNPVYKIRAEVLVDDSNNSPMASMGAIGEFLGSKGKVDNEVFVLSSHSLYKQVVKKMGLNREHFVYHGILKKEFVYPDYPIDATFPNSVQDTLSHIVKIKAEYKTDGKADITVKSSKTTLVDEEGVRLPAVFETPYGPLKIDTTAFYKKGKDLETSITILGYDEAAENLSKNISVDIASKKANVIEIELNTDNKKYGIELLNNLVLLYNLRGINEKNLQGEKTADFIDRRLEILTGDLSESETDIQTYKEKRGIIDVATEAGYQTGVRGKLDEALTEAETQKEILVMTKQFLENSANNFGLVPTRVSEKDVNEGINSYNALVLKHMNLSKSAKPGNASLMQLEEQINAFRATLLKQLDSETSATQAVINQLNQQMANARGKLSQVPLQEREFRNLQRQQVVKQQLYTFLLQRREETAIMLANALPGATIIDEAYSLTEPIGMSKFKIMLIILFIALCVPPVILYIKKLTRTKFSTRDEAEDLLEVPVIGEISTSASGRSLVSTPGSNSSAAELFRLLRTKMLFILDGKEHKIVAVTSSRSGEGKTFVSINLAASLSLMENTKVILIGMDLRQPKLSEYLDLDSAMGLSQYLSSTEISLDKIISNVPGMPNLKVISAGPVPPNPGELLTSKRLEDLIKLLRDKYDYIVIDTAPVGLVSDAYMVNRFADANIFVLRADYTTRSEIKEVNDLYEEGRLKRMSALINGTPRKSTYGYGAQNNE